MVLDYTAQLNNYYSLNDYTGAAKFLESEAMNKNDDKTTAQRMTLLRESRKLARWGRHVSAIINAAKPEDKEKLAHYFRMKAGVTSKSDIDSPYNKALNNIGDKDDMKADYITYTFDTENAYIKFKQSLGGDEVFFNKDKRISGFGQENGKHTYTIFKSDLIKGSTFNNVNRALSNIPTNPTYGSSITGMPIVYNGTLPFSSTSYDYDGNKIKTDYGVDNSQRIAGNYAKEVDELYNSILKNANIKTSAELTSFDYKNAAHRDIVNAVLQGRLEKTIGEFWLKQNDDAIKRIIMSMGLSSSNYDIYTTEANGETQNLYEVENKDKLSLTEEIQRAFSENRVTISAGAAGGRTGTIISIVGKNKEKGGADDNKPYRTVFIPGLLDADAQELMDSDDDAAAYVKMSECQAYGSSYELRDGGILSDFQSNGSAILNLKGGGAKLLSPEEVSRLMKTNEALNFGIRELQNKLVENNFNIDGVVEDAKMYARNLYAVYNNGKQPEDYKSATKKAEAEAIIREYVNIILGANGLK